MKRNYYHNHGPLASKANMRRLAITADFRCDMQDPRNARYLRPLAIAADEETANDMAGIVYCSIVNDIGKDRGFNPDEVRLQCLVNARRMLRDIEYWSLFDGAENFITPRH